MAKPASWKPGESGNPNGRPKKGYSITDWFKGMLEKDPQIREVLGKSIMAKALKGDPTAQKLVWSYMDGMPPQSIMLAGDSDNPIKLEVDTVLNKIYGQANPPVVGKLPKDS